MIELDEASKTALETLRLAKAELAKIKETQESWDGIKDQAQDVVADFLGESEEGTVDGHVVVTYKATTRTTVDTKRLKAEIPAEVLAPYLRTTSTRYVKPVGE